MADNWSASPITLTDAGDWAKWSITLDSTAAANLNNAAADPVNNLTLRMALSAASRRGDYALMINDKTAASGTEVANSSSGWISANRFAYDFIAGGSNVTESQAVDFPGPTEHFVTVEPWVAGANTIRLLWYGDGDNANAAEPIEIDFLAVQSGAAPYIVTTWNDDGDAVLNNKPVTVPFTHVGYDDHVDPDPISIGGTPPATWILEGSEATTGTAGDSLLEITKFCPPVAHVRVTGSGSPVSGIVGVEQAGTVDLATLDGNGRATLTVPGGFTDPFFWFGGNDDWAPALVTIDATTLIRCSGWHVGRIGVG